jgi:hypothetical protein
MYSNATQMWQWITEIIRATDAEPKPATTLKMIVEPGPSDPYA